MQWRATNGANFGTTTEHTGEKSTALQALSWLANLSLVDYGYMLPKDLEDRVELKRSLGCGSVGHVFHGVLKSTSENVVIKMFDKPRYKNSERDFINIKKQ